MGGLKDTMKNFEAPKHKGVDKPKGTAKTLISLRIEDRTINEMRLLVARMKAKGYKVSQSTLMEEGFKVVLDKYKDI